MKRVKAPPKNQVRYKLVAGWHGYRVGDDGSVWSRWGRGKQGLTDKWHEIRGGFDKDGYRKVILCRNGRRRYARVATLILEAFVGPIPKGKLAAYDDGKRCNNALSNLRCDTQLGNIADKVKHGTAQIGEKHGCHKLTEAGVRLLRARRKVGVPEKVVARDLGITVHTVRAVLSGRLWKHVT